MCAAGGINNVEAFWEGPQFEAAGEVELLEAAQLSKPFGEWRAKPSGTRVAQGKWRMRRSLCAAGDWTFGEGPQALAVKEVEFHEAVQLSEPFGEWRVRPSGSRVVQGAWWIRRSACTTCRLNCVEACWERQ